MHQPHTHRFRPGAGGRVIAATALALTLAFPPAALAVPQPQPAASAQAQEQGTSSPEAGSPAPDGSTGAPAPSSASAASGQATSAPAQTESGTNEPAAHPDRQRSADAETRAGQDPAGRDGTEGSAGSAASPEAQPSSGAPGSFPTHGAIGARHRADGGDRARYGRTISPETCTDAGCYQRFERGTLVWSRSTPTSLIQGAFQDRWLGEGALGSPLGVPVGDERLSSGGRAAEQRFQRGDQRGSLYWTAWGTGTRYVKATGAIGDLWLRDGGYAGSRYGYPTGEEQCGLALGACLQRFERSVIVWAPSGQGTHRISGAFLARWEAEGGPASGMGVPAEDERALVSGKAYSQRFSRGGGTSTGLYWTSWGTGTHTVNLRGAIGGFWSSHGSHTQAGRDGAGTRYGFPVTDEICADGSCHQRFENGVVTWSARNGVWGGEAAKCHVLNDGSSRYSAQGAARVALALAPRYSTGRYDPVGSHGTLYSCRRVEGMYIQDWKTPAAFGESGFLAPTRRIRDAETGELLAPGVTGNTAGGFSPTGSFGLSNPYGVGNPGTGFSGYHTLNPASRWGGDRNTWYYNRYVENAALGYPNENMWNFALRGEYRQGLLIDYNRRADGSIPSGTAGFAIMLHTVKYAAPGNTVGSYQSWGCVSIAPERMTQFLREGRDGDRMIMGVESEVIR